MTGLDAVKRINEIDSEVETLQSILNDIKPSHGLNDYRINLINKIIERYKDEQQKLFDRLEKQSV